MGSSVITENNWKSLTKSITNNRIEYIQPKTGIELMTLRVDKRQRKLKGQSIMDKPETPAILRQNTKRRQTVRNSQHRKLKT